MSSSANDPTRLTWTEVDAELRDLADTLGVVQNPREAQLHAALDELARAGWDIPTEAEALTWAEESR